VSQQRSVKDMPLMRNMLSFPEFTEGWALYAEGLAAEMGLYQNDQVGDLGRLQFELFRAVRVVVDTGIHHERWTREEAVAYMAATTGDSLSDSAREVERYAVWPGQACAYTLGELRIRAIRNRAEAELGARFDVRKFHDAVLANGSMPLDVLEREIDRWIAGQKSAA
jgi:uncharacterized protein (DUF885 family)